MTRRQEEYRELIARGLTQKEIGAELGVVASTVSHMVGRLCGENKPPRPPRSERKPTELELEHYRRLLSDGMDRRMMADECSVSVATTFRWIPGLSGGAGGRPIGSGKRKAAPVDRSAQIRQREAEKRQRLIAEMRAG